MKFGLHKQKPLVVKFYEKHLLVPKLLYVYKCLGGAVSVCAVQCCEHAAVFARCYACVLHTTSRA